MIRKILKLVIILLVLLILLNLPMFASIGNSNLYELQREAVGWNYIGVSANYLSFFFLWKLSRKPLGYFGVHLGRWKGNIRWYSIFTISIILMIQMIDFLAEGSISFHIPSFSTILFQLIYVAIGEELFWRGYIQTEYGFWTASVTFGLFHFMNIFSNDISFLAAITWAISATILGMAMGIIRKKTDSIYPSVLLHGSINILNHIISA